MAEFLVESYRPRAHAERLEAFVQRVELVARAMSAEGERVRHMRTTFVPEDETCFHVFDGTSREAVAEVAARAGLADFRVVEAVAYPCEEGSGR